MEEMEMSICRRDSVIKTDFSHTEDNHPCNSCQANQCNCKPVIFYIATFCYILYSKPHYSRIMLDSGIKLDID